MNLNDVCYAMIQYYHDDPKRIQHFIKVHALSKLIAESENLPQDETYILEIAAYVHDIGIKKSEELYHDCNGKHQEELGPELAKELLIHLGCEDVVIQKVCYLVGHHHTYTNIDGSMYQILVEADFLVNLYEDNVPKSGVANAYKNIFRTEAGRRICRDMFGLSDGDGLLSE